MCNCNSNSNFFNGKSKQRKALRQEGGLTRKESRQVSRGMQQIVKGQKRLSGGIVNPAKEGVERPLANQNPAMNPIDVAEVVANPSLVVGTTPKEVVNPAITGAPTNPNPSFSQTGTAQPNPASQSGQRDLEREAPTQDAEDVEEVEEEAPTNKTVSNASTKKKNKMMWVWIGGGLFAFLILVLLLFFLLKKS